MGFDAFCKSAGFDTYYGRNEYPDQADFDGHWGIWDEPYLQYIARTLDKIPQPFMSAVFTLSSHHPYKVPDKFKNRFREGPLEIQETIMYSDYALQKFFETASTMPWFQNTIFVITADHTSEAWQAFYKNRVGQYFIPIIFYEPGSESAGHQGTIAQQTDIMPTLLDMLHYPKPFISFGGSLLRSNEPRFNLSYLNGNYQLIQDGYAWQTDHTISNALYNFEHDSSLAINLYAHQKNISSEKDKLLKAVIQQYNNRMIENRLSIH
jgi:phosphoglycerol transferase MdoB-like AlkP superfamily enzyme